MGAGHSLIRELEQAIESGSAGKRVNVLRRITDLFLTDAERLSDQQISVFDDVLGHLIETIEGKVRAELSARLAPVGNAPIGIVRRLAYDDDIQVAAPVLTQSTCLTTNDLVSLANTRSQAHLLAMSGRAQLNAAVTDALLQRGDRSVVHHLAGNSGACFSEPGFANLVKHSETDEALAEKIGLRPDIPPRLFRQLVMQATETVRSRLMTSAGLQSRERLQRVLAAVSNGIERDIAGNRDTDVAAAQRLVLLMQKREELNEAALSKFAAANQYNEMVAAIALLCSASFSLIEQLIHSDQREVFLIPCKAAGFSWSTVKAILKCRSPGHVLAEHDIGRAKEDYLRLSTSSAQRVLRFWQVRQTTCKLNELPQPVGANTSLGRQSLGAS
jgi:uncharacterized protein (DUF2336 family)